MSKRRVCACGCGLELPKPVGRRRYATIECRRTAAAARERERAATKASPRTAPAKKPPRVVRAYGDLSANGQIYVPGHPLATANGWAGERRFTFYERFGAAWACAATGSPVDWADAKVIDDDGELVALCGRHNQIRYTSIALLGQPGAPDGLEAWLESLMRTPCGPARPTT